MYFMRTFISMAEKQVLKPKVLVISGTTAVGKTDLSLHLAKRLNGEVISADSAQVFRRMNVGTAKADQETMQDVPHHLIDIVTLRDSYKFNAGVFRDMTFKTIQDIASRGRVPIIVGGTGLYVKTLLEGCDHTAPPSSPQGKSQVDDIIKGKSWDESFQILAGMDSQYAETLSRGDWYRLRRAVEICVVSGKSVTHFKKTVNLDQLPFDPKCLFLTMPRGLLYQRIESRCELIIQNGLFEEVIDLVLNHGLVPDSQAGRCIGYRQTLDYLKDAWGFPSQKGENPQLPLVDIKSEAAEKIFAEYVLQYEAATRQLAHNQLTWHRREDHFTWLNMAPRGELVSLDRVSDPVCDWFLEGTALPQELNGTGLKQLSKEELKALKIAKTEVHLDVPLCLRRIRQLLSDKH